MSKRRLSVLGVPVDAMDIVAALDVAESHIASGLEPGLVLAVNPEKVYALRNDPVLQQAFRQARLVLADGIGIALAVRILLGRRISRVTGVDFMHAVCGRATQRGYRIFVYGASPEVNHKAVCELRRRYPGIQIVGAADGFSEHSQRGGLVRRINESQAQILFVALGSPRQEHWMIKYAPGLKVQVCQGVGGALDTVAGAVKRAPWIFRSAGLEWLYRLLRQPSRWRRQVRLAKFAMEVLTTALRQALSRSRAPINLEGPTA